MYERAAIVAQRQSKMFGFPFLPYPKVLTQEPESPHFVISVKTFPSFLIKSHKHIVC